MTLGERITFLREEKNMSQKDLARELNITAATLSRYENDIYQPKLEFLPDMCRILNTSSDFLLGITEKNGTSPISNIPSFINELSLSEYNLLKKYRSLNKENQTRIDERLLCLNQLQGNNQ